MDTNTQYEQREHSLFLKQLDENEKQPIRDRRESRETLTASLKEHPEVFCERMGWLTNGSYGYGAMKQWQRLSSKMNRHAWLFVTTASVEYSVANKDAREIWKALPKGTQAMITFAIDELLHELKNDGSNA